jgi:hypothetical protein
MFWVLHSLLIQHAFMIFLPSALICLQTCFEVNIWKEEEGSNTILDVARFGAFKVPWIEHGGYVKTIFSFLVIGDN